MEKHAVIRNDACMAETCSVCLAAEACTHNIIEQEAQGESPVIWSASLCVGCGKCAHACPHNAVFIQHGSQAGV